MGPTGVAFEWVLLNAQASLSNPRAPRGIAPVYRPWGSYSRHYLAPGEELWVYAYPSDGCGTESVGCKSLIPNLRCGLRYTVPCRDVKERMGASALEGYVGEDVSKSQIVGIGEHGHTCTVFTILLRQHGNGNAIRSRPPPNHNHHPLSRPSCMQIRSRGKE